MLSSAPGQATPGNPDQLAREQSIANRHSASGGLNADRSAACGGSWAWPCPHRWVASRSNSEEACIAAASHPHAFTAEESLACLKEGNERFVNGLARFPTVQKEVLADLAKGQHPHTTILGCSDSRVPPELVFDA
jgi:hypothetical protein